jgi:hypothetical protein
MKTQFFYISRWKTVNFAKSKHCRFLLHFVVYIIYKSLHHHLQCFRACSIAHYFLANLRSADSLSFCAHINTVLTVATFEPSCRYEAQAVSLSFQYSRWSIGFFHRVFAFVRDEPNILSSHFIRVVPSCFCQTVTIPFVCVNRGLLLQDLGVSIANGLALVRVSSPAARLHGNSILRKDVSLNGLEAWHLKNLINSCREIGF